MRQAVRAIGRMFLFLCLVAGLGTFGACSAENRLSVLDRPHNEFDDPQSRLPESFGGGLPDEWRWVGEIPEGRIYLGLNQDGIVCTVAEYGSERAFMNCGRTVADLPQYAAFYAGEGRELTAYIVVQDGLDYVESNDGLFCLVESNMATIVNPTGHESFTARSFDGKRSVEVEGGDASEFTFPEGVRYCA
ncbi:hypothetical protein [Propionimicrobium sp. PCR01-08-3]|uniref:hypothetical protein n=1 Tax=Propionimicrobium sp. PCR01-08-3 TaxID=3052086 RepID=UPI00255D0ED6|nr:hypothetical protein [Propionimicrobium sp. PCR01-08-3]WIY83304.1 hypothetical protein QQ658_02785 [Propionimicrobium sp. PCR01-08-3]